MTQNRYTFSQVARMLDVSISSVWRWHSKGVKGRKLDSILIGGRRWVRQSDLDAFCGFSVTRSDQSLSHRVASRKLDALGIVTKDGPSH